MIRTRESKSAPVGVVTKVLRILETLHRSPSGLQLKDIAKQTAINKSTAYHFLAHLESEGYLFRDDGGAYLIGPENVAAGRNESRGNIAQAEPPPAAEVMGADRQNGESGNDGWSAGALFGARRPLYCTSLGKAMAAFLPQEEADEMLRGLTYERFTPKTLVQPAKLKREFAKVREQGFAIDDEEAVPGARCVAAPIFDASGKVIGALSVSGPITRMAADKLQTLSTAVKKAASIISTRSGHAGL